MRVYIYLDSEGIESLYAQTTDRVELELGADATILSQQSGLSAVKLRTLTATKTTGAIGEYIKARVDLRLAETIVHHRVLPISG